VTSGLRVRGHQSPGTSGAAVTMSLVPRISEFYGIVIAMYYREHGVPHLWARARDDAPLVRIDPLP
jgi:hypothetical protein